jgi:hypothetical protein
MGGGVEYLHWRLLRYDPDIKNYVQYRSIIKLGSAVHYFNTAGIITDVRKRKGMKEGIPHLSNFLDKLWQKILLVRCMIDFTGETLHSHIMQL